VAQALAQAHAASISVACGARIAAALQLQRQHHVLQRRQVGQQLEALEHEAHLLRPHRGARVLVEREQVRRRAARCRVVGVSRPAMIDSSVLLPEPDAPTMATDSAPPG
jgi:hypothetical protein